jgi:type I restriction enzyme, S subunit
MFPARTLGELTENFDAERRPVKASDRRSGPYPYYGAQGVVDHVDGFLFDGEYVLVAEDGENLRSRKAPIALMAKGRFWVNNHAHILRGNQNANSRFLFYAINSADIAGYITGSTIPKLSQGSLNTITIPCPPIQVQNEIVSILGALDDKIELNRRMNETLEAMARAIFQDWFVTFGPTRAKMEGRPPYLAPDLWSLFPDRLDAEGKPEGWTLKTFGSFFSLERGLSYKGEFLVPGGKPMINLGCFAGDGKFLSEKVKPYVGQFRPRHTVSVGDLVLANTDMTQNRAVLGSPHIVDIGFGEDVLFSHHVFAARPRAPQAHKWIPFFYYHMLQADFRMRAEGFATGTTVLFLPAEAAQNCSFAIPDDEINAGFVNTIAPLRDRQAANSRESFTLTATRDLLLPRLMSGELRVKDAERAVEAAA